MSVESQSSGFVRFRVESQAITELDVFAKVFASFCDMYSCKSHFKTVATNDEQGTPVARSIWMCWTQDMAAEECEACLSRIATESVVDIIACRRMCEHYDARLRVEVCCETWGDTVLVSLGSQVVRWLAAIEAEFLFRTEWSDADEAE